MVRTRENASEFGTAARAGKLLRIAFQALVHSVADKRMVRRLTSKMLEVLQADSKSGRGLRKVFEGSVELLEGFEFNETGKLSITFCAPHAADINRATGELRISIPPFIPQNLVAAPETATHFKFNSAAAAVDFENGSFSVDTQSSPLLALNGMATDEIVFNSVRPANTTVPLFLLLGVTFFQEVNASMYPLKDSSFNALAIVKVSTS
jgi:hypothetical protein